ncbi:MAG: hypothetical protein QM537_09580 [Candidatus Symbiobacter sp.]|nr:hypothetical protein [Candidatus Symbiobacter sp.]
MKLKIPPKFRSGGIFMLAVGLGLVYVPAWGQAVNRESYGTNPERERRDTTANAVDKLVKTKLPYWQVGWIDKQLSQECSLGRFNQRIPYRYVAHFAGNQGSAMVGGVKGNGLNLYDPRGQASPEKDYWFYRDGSAECIVMWAYVKPDQNQIMTKNGQSFDQDFASKPFAPITPPGGGTR